MELPRAPCHTARCLFPAPERLPHVAESLGNPAPAPAAQIPSRCLTRSLVLCSLGLGSSTLDASPRVAARFLCLLSAPLGSRGLGDAPRLAPKPDVGVGSVVVRRSLRLGGPTTRPLVSRSRIVTRRDARALRLGSGRSGNGTEQPTLACSGTHSCKVLLQWEVTGQEGPLARAAALHRWPGTTPYRYRIATVSPPYHRTVSISTIHPKIWRAAASQPQLSASRQRTETGSDTFDMLQYFLFTHLTH